MALSFTVSPFLEFDRKRGRIYIPCADLNCQKGKGSSSNGELHDDAIRWPFQLRMFLEGKRMILNGSEGVAQYVHEVESTSEMGQSSVFIHIWSSPHIHQWSSVLHTNPTHSGSSRGQANSTIIYGFVGGQLTSLSASYFLRFSFPIMEQCGVEWEWCGPPTSDFPTSCCYYCKVHTASAFTPFFFGNFGCRALETIQIKLRLGILRTLRLMPRFVAKSSIGYDGVWGQTGTQKKGVSGAAQKSRLYLTKSVMITVSLFSPPHCLIGHRQ